MPENRDEAKDAEAHVEEGKYFGCLIKPTRKQNTSKKYRINRSWISKENLGIRGFCLFFDDGWWLW